MRGSPAERFWAKVQKTPTCWLWIGATDGRGRYGGFRLNGRTVRAHRFAYELLVAPIPEGKELDHIKDRCSSTLCVNPDHLEPVSHAENVRRGVSGLVNGARNAAKTHCPRGHEYTGSNTLISKGAVGLQRSCRLCHRASDARRRKQ